MKVALLLSGSMTDWTVHYVYFKRYLLDHYDIDVFISTWKGYKVDEIEGVRIILLSLLMLNLKISRIKIIKLKKP